MKRMIASARMQFFILMILSLPSCIHRKQIDKQKLFITQSTLFSKNIMPCTTPSITIWVHGTLILRKPSYHLIFRDKTGLVPVLSLPEDHHFRILAHAMAQQNAEYFPLQEFYIFSWSGKLQELERKKAAHKLHEDIIALKETYVQRYGQDPIIRIIAHSHGCNVVLNMAKIKDKTAFTLESTIMLACPVQEKTKHLICTAIFKRVYALYSSFDIIQIIAPQFKYACMNIPGKTKPKKRYHIPPFSSRVFPTYSHLTQAKIKINDFPISHTKFSTSTFTAMLPHILEKLDQWHSESIAKNTISKYKLLCIYNKNC